MFANVSVILLLLMGAITAFFELICRLERSLQNINESKKMTAETIKIAKNIVEVFVD
jgi:CHASE3 domain sensor protein